MQLSLNKNTLSSLVARQLNNFFPDGNDIAAADLNPFVNSSLEKLENCFSRVSNPRYNDGREPFYNHLYSDHNIVFFWILSNTAWIKANNHELASKIYYLNKAMHAFDCMYDTALPENFLVLHGSGTMLGKAIYGDFLVVMQGCTVGSNNGKYPVIGKGVALTANSAIIGNCRVGDNCTIGTGTTLFERNLESSEVIFTDRYKGSLIIKKSDEGYSKQFFSNYL